MSLSDDPTTPPVPGTEPATPPGPLARRLALGVAAVTIAVSGAFVGYSLHGNDAGAGTFQGPGTGQMPGGFPGTGQTGNQNTSNQMPGGPPGA